MTLNSNVFRLTWKIEGCRELLSSISLQRTTQLLMCLVGKCICASIWVFSLLCQCEHVYITGSMIRQVSECTFDCSLMRAVTWCSQIPQRSPSVPVKFPVLQVREHSPLSCPTSPNEEWSATQRNQLWPSQNHCAQPSPCLSLSLASAQRRTRWKSWVWSNAQAGSSANQSELVHIQISPVSSTDGGSQAGLSLFYPCSSWALGVKCFLQEDPSPETFCGRSEPKLLFHPRMKVHSKHFFYFPKEICHF